MVLGEYHCINIPKGKRSCHDDGFSFFEKKELLSGSLSQNQCRRESTVI